MRYQQEGVKVERSKILNGYVFLTQERANEVEKYTREDMAKFLLGDVHASPQEGVVALEAYLHWREYQKIRVPG